MPGEAVLPLGEGEEEGGEEEEGEHGEEVLKTRGLISKYNSLFSVHHVQCTPCSVYTM